MLSKTVFNRIKILHVGYSLNLFKRQLSLGTTFFSAKQQTSNSAARSDGIVKRFFKKAGPVFGIALGISGALSALIYQKEKKQAEMDVIAQELEKKSSKSKSLAANIGGDFQLIDSNNQPMKMAAFLGRWSLFYFGYCNCPDICPEMMQKMLDAVLCVDQIVGGRHVTPVFVSIDPARDTPAIMKEYIEDFSSRFVGLTGEPDLVHKMAKSFGIYYSLGPKDKYGDYIVDHAMIMYLINPDGDVVDFYGQVKPEKDIANAIVACQKNYIPSTKKRSVPSAKPVALTDAVTRT